MSNHLIAIYGAVGHTGRQVVTELARRGYRLRLGARNAESLRVVLSQHENVEGEPFALADTNALARFAAGATVVVNCAGPFAETAPILVGAALAACAHYVDITGEPPVVADLIERFDVPARAAGRVVLPAAGFFGALPDLLAKAAGDDWTSVEDVTVAYALSGWKMTPGSRAAAAALSDHRHVFVDGRIQIETGPPEIDTWEFPSPRGEVQVMESYPAPEALTLPRHLASKRVRVLMTLSTLAEIRNQVSDHDASDSERAASVFTLAVDVMQAGRHRRVHANGRDIYGLTAPIVGLAVDRLVAAEGLRGGVLAASQVVQPADMLAALKPWGLTVDDAVAIAER